MKIYFIAQLFLGLFLIAQDAKSGPLFHKDLDCRSMLIDNSFLCEGIEYGSLDETKNFEFQISGVRNDEVLDALFRVNPKLNVKAFNGQSTTFDMLINNIAHLNQLPLGRKWTLPSLSLLKLANNGIETIHAKNIYSLINEADLINWDDIFHFRSIDKLKPNRHTGKFNSITNHVVYDGKDLKDRDLSDLKQWSLHELLGTAGINDVNYELSTLVMLVNDGLLSKEEFYRYQHIHNKVKPPYILPTNYLSSSTSLIRGDGDGGVTGVEGGGDIVTASIKRFMLTALRLNKGSGFSEEDLKIILSYDIIYNQFDMFFKSDGSGVDLDPTRPLFLLHNQSVPMLMLKIGIRSEWHRMHYQQKLTLAGQYLNYILKNHIKKKIWMTTL